MSAAMLKERARLLQQLRQFFCEKGFLEVQTPLASHEIIPEAHINPPQLSDGRYLQASPEMHHKLLLCQGVGPLFEVTKSFRGGEHGRLHRPEFTMVEWYRPGDSMQDGIDLLDELIQLLLGVPRAKRTSYREAFLRVYDTDPFLAQDCVLQGLAEEALGEGLGVIAHNPSTLRDDCLNALLSLGVEPMLGIDTPEVLYHYPETQAALAEVEADEHGKAVAQRFELYYQGVELANGYYELTDPQEMRRRLEDANQIRCDQAEAALPLPETLLKSMESRGLPCCAGVALGFDRLVMLATGTESISEVIACD